MRNIFLISVCVLACFVAEYFLAQWLPAWFQPNLLLLFVIFFNLYRGIRHSLLVAFFSGLIQDSFAPQIFGLNIFALMLCAYCTTLLKMYIYESGSVVSRLFLVFLITTLYVLVVFCLRMIFIPFHFWSAMHYIMLPQIFATTVFSIYILKAFRQCALKLFA